MKVHVWNERQKLCIAVALVVLQICLACCGESNASPLCIVHCHDGGGNNDDDSDEDDNWNYNMKYSNNKQR
jgi:hypothetical protein